MKYAEILRGDLEKLRAEREAEVATMEQVTAAAEAEERANLTDDETVAFEASRARIDEIDGEIARKSERLTELDEIAARAQAASFVPASPVPGGGPAPIDVAMDRQATNQQLADAVTRSLEGRVSADGVGNAREIVSRHLLPFHGDEVVSDDTRRWARDLAARSTPTYARGFVKYLTDGGMSWSNEERAAMAVGTTTAGGFLVPTHLDPTLIFTNDGSSNVIRSLSRNVTLVDGNVWNGVTTAGSTFSWDAELAEVSDDTAAVARASIPVYKAQGFIQASIESLQDIAGLESDIAMIIADARDRLEGTAHATGSGSSQPTGIFTALDANTNVEITSTTAATIGLVDLQAVYRGTGVRWRGKSTWLTHPLFMAQIQALGTALSASYTTNLAEPYSERIFGRPVVLSDDAPSTTTTTALDNVLCFGDFSNFVIVDKPGSASVEFIPHLFNTSNNLPDGRRGFYVYWRSGSDSVNDVAFSLLQDKTSA